MIDELTINLIDVGTQRGERRRLMRQFEGVDVVLYVVDLSDYDRDMPELDSSLIEHEIMCFDGVINHRRFAQSIVVLFLSGMSKFREKLEDDPLVNYFPKYTGGTDVDKAGEYVLQLFNNAIHGQRSLYSYLVDPYDTGNIQLVAAAIKDSIRSKPTEQSL